jgi:hypothetical protein
MRRASVQQKIEGTCAVDHCLNDDQVSVAQFEFDGLARLRFLRRQGRG